MRSEHRHDEVHFRFLAALPKTTALRASTMSFEGSRYGWRKFPADIGVVHGRPARMRCLIYTTLAVVKFGRLTEIIIINANLCEALTLHARFRTAAYGDESIRPKSMRDAHIITL